MTDGFKRNTMRTHGVETVKFTYDAATWDAVDDPTAIDSIMQFINNCERDLRLLPILAKSGDQETGWVYEVMVSDDHKHLYMVLDGAWTIHELKVAPEGGLDLIEVYTPSKGQADTLAHLSTTLRVSKHFNLIL